MNENSIMDGAIETGSTYISIWCIALIVSSKRF